MRHRGSIACRRSSLRFAIDARKLYGTTFDSEHGWGRGLDLA
jgi:hypothetical protein